MRISNRFQTQFLRFWHAIFSGGFIVAYVTEDVYAMHMFSGTVVLGAVAVRVLLGWMARDKSPLALSNPMDATRLWWERVSSGAKARNPLYAWFATALLGIIGLAAATGWLAELLPFTKDLHEGVAEFTLVVIVGHLGLVFFKPAKKYILEFVQTQSASFLR
ncbi:cytochrome b/b6 domain-containing protein [Magnetovibrio sp.]|uniref:cytochrome b/b6 domain-containing protein n=1 Tax=Magnetovibrio sp. TaxID=2024836 RepID=UPI002F93DAE1